MNRLLTACVVAVLAGGAAIPAAVRAEASGSTGYDISWPQCTSNGGASAPSGGAFGIVGVTDGLPWSQNPCLASEAHWADTRAGQPAVYMNTADPGTRSTHWSIGGPKGAACDPANTDAASAAFIACAYDYGWNAARDAYGRAAPIAGAANQTWWLDVEVGNSWNGGGPANAEDVQGSLDYLHSTGVSVVGVYSTAYQWNTITGGYKFSSSTPEWLAGAGSVHQAQSFCGQTPFGGLNSRITLTQYHASGFDADLPC